MANSVSCGMVNCLLTLCGLAKPYGDIDLGQHWLRQRFVAWQHQAFTWTNINLSFRNVQCHYSDDNFTKDTPATHHWCQLENCLSEIGFKSLGGHWVNDVWQFWKKAMTHEIDRSCSNIQDYLMVIMGIPLLVSPGNIVLFDLPH